MPKAAVQTYKAGARYVRISPYKVREVAAIIKGKHVDEARRILAFTPKAASHEMNKVLESAIANAEHNFQVPQEELYVRFVSADEGVTIKRFRARAQGRGYRIRKRTSHIQLELERRQPETVERPRRAAVRRGTSAPQPPPRGATRPATPKGGSKAEATSSGSARSKGGSKPKPESPPKGGSSRGSSAEEKKGAATPKGESDKGKATTSERKASAGRSKAKSEGASSSKTSKIGS